MSYNGVGLQTTRGSGTSGYIQKNSATKNVEGFREKRLRDESEAKRREVRARLKNARRFAGKEMKEHLEKRQVDVRCMELRDELENENVDEETIKERIGKLREQLLSGKKKVSEDSSDIGFHNVSRRELVEFQDREKTEKSARSTEGKKDIEDESREKGGNVPCGKQPKTERANKQFSAIEKAYPYNYLPRYGKR